MNDTDQWKFILPKKCSEHQKTNISREEKDHSGYSKITLSLLHMSIFIIIMIIVAISPAHLGSLFFFYRRKRASFTCANVLRFSAHSSIIFCAKVPRFCAIGHRCLMWHCPKPRTYTRHIVGDVNISIIILGILSQEGSVRDISSFIFALQVAFSPLALYFIPNRRWEIFP